MAESVVTELIIDNDKNMKTENENNNNEEEKHHQWVEISPLSSFTTKWSLFSKMNDTFGNVTNVMINQDHSAKILFTNIESASKCHKYYTSHPCLDGERIRIEFCDDSNVTKTNAKKCLAILTKKLNGISDPGLIEKIKFCADTLDRMTPLHICRFHSKILSLLSSSVSMNESSAIFITDAFSNIGIDCYVFSDYFNCVNAIESNDILYNNLVFNVKLFGRYGTPIKCIKNSFFDIYDKISSHIIYIDTFCINNSINRIQWTDCYADIEYIDNHQKKKSLSLLCNDIYQCNQNKINGKNIVPLQLIAVKVPKHFMVAEFQQKVTNCHIIVFDFKFHQLMILDYLHGLNELRSLEFKCKDKRLEMGFFKSIIFQHTNQNNNNSLKNNDGPPLKKRKLNNDNNNNDDIDITMDHRQEVTVKDIAYKVKMHLTRLGFRQFGEEHCKNFREKLRKQIYSKQLIREQLTEINLQSKFDIIRNEIKEWMDNKNENGDNKSWIGPNIIGPRYVIYATSQWVMLVDEYQNMWYHQTFNDFYKKIFFGINLKHNQNQEQILKTVSIVDGYLIPTDYFGKMDDDKSNNHWSNNNGGNNRNNSNEAGTRNDRTVSPLQFWILDILSYQNKTSIVMKDRFTFFTKIVKSYNRECKYLQNGPISIHLVHYEEYKNINNLVKFICQYTTDINNGCYRDCIIYGNSQGDKHAIDGFVVMKNKKPCIIHNRNEYNKDCILWKCDFSTLLSQHELFKLRQKKNAVMFQK